MLHSRTYEGRPPWGRAVYTALHGARLSSVPSGDQSANPAVFQGAAVSSERFSQSLPPRNVAELGGSPPLRGSLEQLDRPSPAGPPFQGHRASRSKYTRGQSQETGFLSKSSGGVGALAKRVLLGPAWADSGSLVFLEMTRVWGPSFPIGDF